MTDYNALDNRTAVSLKGGSSNLIYAIILLTRIQTIRGSSLCRMTDFWMDILPCSPPSPFWQMSGYLKLGYYRFLSHPFHSSHEHLLAQLLVASLLEP